MPSSTPGGIAGIVYLEDDDDDGAAKEPWDPDEERNRKEA